MQEVQHWIEEAQLGDQNAWEQIVQHFSGMAFSVAYTRLGDWSLVEDTVQEAFAEAFSNLHKLQEAEAFPGWFKTIVERQCHRLLRPKKPMMMPLDETIVMDVEKFDVELIAERREWHQKLHQSVEGLSDKLNWRFSCTIFKGCKVI